MTDFTEMDIALRELGRARRTAVPSVVANETRRTTMTPTNIIKEGHLYFRYAGPWRGGSGKRPTRIDHDKPWDVIEELFALGEIDTTDRPIVHNGAVYLIDE